MVLHVCFIEHSFAIALSFAVYCRSEDARDWSGAGTGNQRKLDGAEWHSPLLIRPLLLLWLFGERLTDTGQLYLDEQPDQVSSFMPETSAFRSHQLRSDKVTKSKHKRQKEHVYTR
jgi:hypothetical protein